MEVINPIAEELAECPWSCPTCTFAHGMTASLSVVILTRLRVEYKYMYWNQVVVSIDPMRGQGSKRKFARVPYNVMFRILRRNPIQWKQPGEL